jgi:hypothetical protein
MNLIKRSPTTRINKSFKPLAIHLSFLLHKRRVFLFTRAKEAVVTNRLTRNEAPGPLSNLVCEIWESCEPVTWKLPG